MRERIVGSVGVAVDWSLGSCAGTGDGTDAGVSAGAAAGAAAGGGAGTGVGVGDGVGAGAGVGAGVAPGSAGSGTWRVLGVVTCSGGAAGWWTTAGCELGAIPGTTTLASWLAGAAGTNTGRLETVRWGATLWCLTAIGAGATSTTAGAWIASRRSGASWRPEVSR